MFLITGCCDEDYSQFAEGYGKVKYIIAENTMEASTYIALLMCGGDLCPQSVIGRVKDMCDEKWTKYARFLKYFWKKRDVPQFMFEFYFPGHVDLIMSSESCDLSQFRMEDTNVRESVWILFYMIRDSHLELTYNEMKHLAKLTRNAGDGPSYPIFTISQGKIGEIAHEY